MKDLEIDVARVGKGRRRGVATRGWERIRVWQQRSFRLELFDTGRVEGGRPRLAYRFCDGRMGKRPIFEGEDFSLSPVDATQSDAVVASLLIFLSLQPADVGAEYFERFSKRQMEWVEGYADELALLAFELREREEEV